MCHVLVRHIDTADRRGDCAWDKANREEDNGPCKVDAEPSSGAPGRGDGHHRDGGDDRETQPNAGRPAYQMNKSSVGVIAVARNLTCEPSAKAEVGDDSGVDPKIYGDGVVTRAGRTEGPRSYHRQYPREDAPRDVRRERRGGVGEDAARDVAVGVVVRGRRGHRG